jgi:hypothetical protein|tara:strand:- start:4454 stop:4618 length:165 start_codon:yes stop_codon:yes gene_type:complete
MDARRRRSRAVPRGGARWTLDDDDDDGDGARGWEARARSSGGVADGRETMRVGV